jgi:hypothetical protein
MLQQCMVAAATAGRPGGDRARPARLARSRRASALCLALPLLLFCFGVRKKEGAAATGRRAS